VLRKGSRILAAGFDGVYLDIIDAFEFLISSYRYVPEARYFNNPTL